MLQIGKTETDVRKRLDAQKRALSEGLAAAGPGSAVIVPMKHCPLALDAPLRVLFLRLLKADDRGGGRVIG